MGRRIGLLLCSCASAGAIALPAPVQGYFNRWQAGVTGQWDSFQECQRIRKSRRLDPDRGLSFEEQEHLREAVSDRWRLITLGFWYNFSPELALFFCVLPSAWPAWLPSHFHDGESKLKRYSDDARRRLQACYQMVKRLDEDTYRWQWRPDQDKPNKKREQLTLCVKTVQEAFQCTSKAEAVQILSRLYDGPMDVEEFDLKKIPKPVVNAACKCIGADGWFTPAMFKRGTLLKHLKHLKVTDDALLKDRNVPDRLLQQACTDRCIGTPTMSEQKLRASLDDYLNILKTKEGQMNPLGVRLALIGVNSLEAARLAPDTQLHRGLYSASMMK